MNTLYYGDNLKILRDYIKDETVDLVYLDPPFNSNRNYNVLFKDESGAEADSQITAFEDTWHWNASAERTYLELIQVGDEVARMIEAFRSFIGNNQMMAYLVMMAVRLKELHRVLKPTGSLYLHCDPTASAYLKILLDAIFGTEHFVNEIVWKRSDAHNDGKQGSTHFGRIHDTLLFYAKGKIHQWNSQHTPLPQKTIDSWYNNVEPGTGRHFNKADLTAAKPGGDTKYEWKGVPPPVGRYWAYSREKMEQMEKDGRIVYSASGRPYMKRYLDESKGVSIQDWWDDIDMLRGMHKDGERLGYPTQKPGALLERILLASSNEGDVVLDPFCGCGTTIAAAQKLNRQWIGIDITHLSIALQKYRLKDAFGLEPIGSKATRKSEPPALAGGTDANMTAPGDTKVDSHPTPVPPAYAGGSDKNATATYRIIGEPEDLDGARQLATEDRYQFQWWALSLIKARPLGGSTGSKEGKKGSDKGIDGTLVFVDDNSGKAKRVIVQVKSGHVKSGDIRDLGHTADRENAAIGVFITLEKPSRDMLTESVGKGFYHSPGWNKDYPKLQILTIEDLLAGAQIEMPQTSITFKQAEKMSEDGANQNTLGFE